MMGYIDDIDLKLKEMKNKELHEEFIAITEVLLAGNHVDLFPAMYRIIEKYDKVIRENVGLKKTNDNLLRKIYGRSNEYVGGNYGKKEKQL